MTDRQLESVVILYLLVLVVVIMFGFPGCSPTEVGDEMERMAPKVIEGTAKADIWTVEVNGQDLTLQPGSTTEVVVNRMPVTIYAWNNGVKGPRFQFAKDLPECPEYPALNDSPVAMRATYGDGPNPWPVSMRVEENGASWNVNEFTQDWLYVRFEEWDLGVYSAPSPWLKLVVGGGKNGPDKEMQ